MTSATATTVQFQINPDALRTSQFVPQSGRTDVAITFPGQSKDFDSTAVYGSLTFTPTGTFGETITAATANAFSDANGVTPKPGELITLKSGTGVNDGVYEVVSNNGTSIVVKSKTVWTDSSSTASVSSTSWYKGDTSTLQQRIDSDTSVDIALYAADPAFEKAFRAMGLIAQGAVGTAGGLENNQDRLNAARFLIYDATDGSAVGPAPYGTEERGNMESLQSKVGVTQAVIKDRNDKHQQFIALFQARSDDIENVDMTEAIATLLDDQRAMEASYQTLSTVRSLSLLNYLK
ncbi:MAG: flagellin [Magnetospirillum sp.]|nr:flagellin [Magnetospirillum sp.]